MLYRQRLSLPTEGSHGTSASDEMASQMSPAGESEGDDDVFIKVAVAAQQTLKLYYELHQLQVVNYTLLATHHLFRAGLAFLSALWHSSVVRKRVVRG